MTRYKRPSSDLDGHGNFACKVPRMETMQHKVAVSDAPTSANARISDLEQQIKELHDFIDASGLAPSKSAVTERLRVHVQD